MGIGSKRVVLYICCTILIIPTIVLGNTKDTYLRVGIEEVISPELFEHMETADDNELIPVTIELRDKMDDEAVEEIAIEKSNLTQEKLDMIESGPAKLTDEENIKFQKEYSEIYNEYKKERINAVKEHHTGENVKFLINNNLHEKEYHSISLLTPFIRGICLTKSEIIEVAKNNDVQCIYYTNYTKCVDYASLNFTQQIIDGDLAISEGYTGAGIKVGNVESGHPDLDKMGTDATGIVITNTGETKKHATQVCAIIKKMAPDCSIYSRAVTYPEDAIDACESLVYGYHVDVINVTCGLSSNGTGYTVESRQIDYLIRRAKITIVVAAGNVKTESDIYINILGLAPNAITVGAVSSYGTDPSVSSAFYYREDNLYKENRTCVNKPDICAPGSVSIYDYGNSGGTSFSTPHVTGAVIQMMCRNTALKDKPQAIKSAIMASAQYNAGTSMSHVTGTLASDKEGAGVINAGFCYNVAKNEQKAYFDATSADTVFNQNIYCNSTTKPFRIACTWEVDSGEQETDIYYTYCTDYDMKIYRNGALVATSTANSNSTSLANTNYEIIEIPVSVLSQYGAGYYQVQITRIGDFKGTGTIRIGLAWGQL